VSNRNRTSHPPSRRPVTCSPHHLLTCSFLLAALALPACQREERLFRTRAPSATSTTVVRLSPLQPGTPDPEVHAKNDYESNAYALSQGKQFFSSFNCVGCHAHGGGGMGPALMDDRWLYGSEPEQVFATIMEGRPNGMPSFRGHITDDQGWMLAAYVRSLSGLASAQASPGRDDHMQQGPPENSRERQKPRDSRPSPVGG
jgi:cytochrome c oxidase cbb3-type subunit 3